MMMVSALPGEVLVRILGMVLPVHLGSVKPQLRALGLSCKPLLQALRVRVAERRRAQAAARALADGRTAQAEALYRLAAENDAGAALNLGKLLLGRGSLEEAADWFWRAGTLGAGRGFLNAGRVQLRLERPTLAIRCFGKADTAGCPRGGYEKARLLIAAGRVRPGVQLMWSAALRRSEHAMHRWAWYCRERPETVWAEIQKERGEGTDGEKEGFRWFLAASERGFVPSMEPLAECLEHGIGCEPDKGRAFEWLWVMSKLHGVSARWHETVSDSQRARLGKKLAALSDSLPPSDVLVAKRMAERSVTRMLAQQTVP